MLSVPRQPGAGGGIIEYYRSQVWNLNSFGIQINNYILNYLRLVSSKTLFLFQMDSHKKLMLKAKEEAKEFVRSKAHLRASRGETVLDLHFYFVQEAIAGLHAFLSVSLHFAHQDLTQ